MEIRLKVIGGKNDGKEIPVQVADFLIGRGEKAHLRPASDLVSRSHCTLSSRQGKAILVDHGSRNGTYLNGEAVKGETELKPGDRLRVGRLVFEVMIDIGQPSVKKPKVDGVAQAASRTADGNEEWNDDSISGWLMNVNDPVNTIEETKQFNLEDSGLKLDADASIRDSGDIQSTSNADRDELQAKADENAKAKAKKKVVGKLPDQARQTTDNSKDAATEVLQKFFNRR